MLSKKENEEFVRYATKRLYQLSNPEVGLRSKRKYNASTHGRKANKEWKRKDNARPEKVLANRILHQLDRLANTPRAIASRRVTEQWTKENKSQVDIYKTLYRIAFADSISKKQSKNWYRKQYGLVGDSIRILDHAIKEVKSR